MKLGFDILDPTKIIPQEEVPIRRVGMTLNRNPDNHFAETEQAAFHLGHIVPGVEAQLELALRMPFGMVSVLG
jgi:catalase